jgi:uncharacterized cofD-like protein
MLKVDVNIIPMSEHPSDLKALSVDGNWVHGETSVDEMDTDLLRLDLEPEVPATSEAIAAINHADCIILGPGSFLTSIMPPLLLSELGHAILKNTNATLIYIENLSPEYGPAGRMTLRQKLEWCQRACRGRKIDIVLGDVAHQDLEDEWRCVTVDLASPNRAWRHDRNKLSKAIVEQLK